MSANTREELRESLGYEMWMLHRTQEQSTAWDDPTFKQANPDKAYLRFAVLESFLVHARNLFYFFYPIDKKPHPDDALPKDFYQGIASWPHSRATMPVREGMWLEQINKALQHLSKRRQKLGIVWPEKDIRAALDALFDEFNKLGPIGGPIVAEHPNPVLRSSAPRP
jgi:hypothetical protein